MAVTHHLDPVPMFLCAIVLIYLAIHQMLYALKIAFDDTTCYFLCAQKVVELSYH